MRFRGSTRRSRAGAPESRTSRELTPRTLNLFGNPRPAAPRRDTGPHLPWGSERPLLAPEVAASRATPPIPHRRERTGSAAATPATPRLSRADRGAPTRHIARRSTPGSPSRSSPARPARGACRAASGPSQRANRRWTSPDTRRSGARAPGAAPAPPARRAAESRPRRSPDRAPRPPSRRAPRQSSRAAPGCVRGSAQQLSDAFVQHVGGDGARVLVEDQPVRGDEIRLRHARGAVLDRHPRFGIEQLRKAAPMDGEKRLRVRFSVLEDHSDEVHAAAVLARAPLEHWVLGHARLAPTRPEVQDDRPSSQGGQRHLPWAVE